MADVMSRFGSQETILQAITTELDRRRPRRADVLSDARAHVHLRAGADPGCARAAPPSTGCCAGRSTRRCGRPRRRRSSGRRGATATSSRRCAASSAIKLFNAQEDRRAHWLNLLVETINRQLTTQKLNLLFRTANTLLLGAADDPGRLARRAAGAGTGASRSAC